MWSVALCVFAALYVYVWLYIVCLLDVGVTFLVIGLMHLQFGGQLISCCEQVCLCVRRRGFGLDGCWY